MKHKAWIKNYVNDADKLAEEIGDLRYDSLSEFLELLSNKIEKDGGKDRDRGRVKLADKLKAASDALRLSAGEINAAWQICEPYMFPSDISLKVKIEFKEPVKITAAFKLLLDYYGNGKNDQHFRLARCLLFETNGDLEKLERNINIARTDPRDIFFQAEYDQQSNRVRNLSRSFGTEKISKEDLDNNQYIEDRKDDSLPF